MHFIVALGLFLLSPTFWHDLVAQTPVRVIALAGAVTVTVQVFKVIFPSAISGKWALALNVLVSVAGVYKGMNPAAFWSETTLAQVLMVAAAAAGVHGTAKSLSAKYAAIGDGIPKDQESVDMRREGVHVAGNLAGGNFKLNTTPADPQLATDGARPAPPA